MNKRIKWTCLVVLAAGAAVSSLAAEPPALLNYQGVLRDASDRPLSGNYDMTFRFFNVPTGGVEILVDGHTLASGGQVTATGGLFTVQLGGGTVTDGSGPGTYTSLSAVFRDYEPVWLDIQIGTEALIPRVRVISAGYALNAVYLSGKAWTDFAGVVHQHPGTDITSAVSNSNMLGGQLGSYYLDTSSGTQTKTGRLIVQNSTAGVATGRFENGAGGGDALQALNSTASGTGTGRGVVGQTAQSSGVGVQGSNTHVNGTGVAGSGNNNPPSTLVAGSGGAFTGNTTGLFAKSTNSGISESIYTDNFSNVVRVNYWNGITQYKINGTGTVSSTLEDQEGNRVTVHAPEAPEILLMDVGQGRLVDGFAHVDLDPTLAKNVSVGGAHPLRVFVQLEEDEGSAGVVVKNKTSQGFDVVELGGGKSNAQFQWQVICNRADESLPFGRISRNADMRFEPAGPAAALSSRMDDLSVPGSAPEQTIFGASYASSPRSSGMAMDSGREEAPAGALRSERDSAQSAMVADAQEGRKLEPMVPTAVQCGATAFSTGEEVEIGDVLALDTRWPGHVRRAQLADAAMIVGVAGGAHVTDGGVIQVSATGTGFALVKADAAYGSILPGDILTASATPGYAMRAPRGAATGTVIGKAIETLESGRGLIKVLVMVH